MMERKPSRRTRSEWRQYWQAHLRAWFKEGGTLKAYAQAHGLCVQSFYAARSRLERETRSRTGARDATPPTFVPVRVTGIAAPASDGKVVRVRLRNGIVLEFPVDIDGASCQPLLEVAGRLP